jgi:hypothetical protein
VHDRERKSQRREREGRGGWRWQREREREAMHRESEDGKRILAEIDAMRYKIERARTERGRVVEENTDICREQGYHAPRVRGRQTHTRRNRLNKVHERERETEREKCERRQRNGENPEGERDIMHRGQSKQQSNGKRILTEIDAIRYTLLFVCLLGGGVFSQHNGDG